MKRKTLLFSLLAFSGMVAFGQDVGDFTILVQKMLGKQLVSITEYSGSETNIRIPDMFNGMPITSIYSEVFRNKGLTGVILPSELTMIVEATFANNNLTSLILPNNVREIASAAFLGNKLTSVTLNVKLYAIGAGAFFSNQLTSITIPASVRIIGYGAFSENPLSYITIGANVELGYINNSSERRDSFDNGFDGFYNGSGKKAGTYTWNGAQWAFRP